MEATYGAEVQLGSRCNAGRNYMMTQAWFVGSAAVCALLLIVDARCR
jgi:hypothetical protein